MKLTKKKAIELSILKWDWIVETGETGDDEYDLVHAVPELEGIDEGCGLCHKYLKINKKVYSITCSKCPIDISTKNRIANVAGCWQNGHPFRIHDEHPTKENAQKVLDLIKSIK